MAVRKQTYITEAQDRSIKRLAHAKGVSEAKILRTAIDDYLKAQGASLDEDPYRELIGILDSGDGTGSIRHDSIYDRH